MVTCDACLNCSAPPCSTNSKVSTCLLIPGCQATLNPPVPKVPRRDSFEAATGTILLSLVQLQLGWEAFSNRAWRARGLVICVCAYRPNVIPKLCHVECDLDLHVHRWLQFGTILLDLGTKSAQHGQLVRVPR